MDTGTKISGAAHVALIALAFLGVGFEQEPLPFAVQEVSVISAREFAALTGQGAAPDVTDAAAPPAPPVTPGSADAPEAPGAEDARPETAALAQPEPAPPPEQPPVAEAAPPQNEVETSEDVAILVVPQEPITSLPQSPAPRPEPRPIERVAPVPVAAPPPDATPDPVAQEEVVPDDASQTPRVPQEARAPEEATDRIVTEADETSTLAPTRAPRPPRPPVRVAEAPEIEPEVEPETETEVEPETKPEAEPASEPAAQPAEDTASAARTGDAVAAALSEALSGDVRTPPAGPPLTSTEKDALRVAVSQCWNVGSLSSAALATTVVVALDMTRDGKPVANSIRMVSSEGGSGDAARQAFEAARRAIIRCGARGFDLPAEKYAQWQDIEMTFNPERMRIR